MIYLLIGGGIAILSSLVTQLIDFLKDFFAEKRKRNHEKEEKKVRSKSIVISKRLDQMEDFATKTITTVNFFMNNYSKFKKSNLPIQDANEQYLEFLNNNHLVPLAIILGDKDLENAAITFGKAYSQIFDLLTEFYAKKQLDENEFFDKFEVLQISYISILKFLDEYRIKNSFPY